MQKFEITVKDPVGIHARPAGVIVKQAQALSSHITVTCNGKKADLKKLLSVMGLCAKCGDILYVCVEGDNELEDTERLMEILKTV